MLTVKHIDMQGVETIMEAERIEVVRDKSFHEDGIFLDRDPAPLNVACDLSCAAEPEFRGFKHVIHFARARSTNDVPPRVFVMNRFGATVATYNL
jgi:hypothetical protein